MKKIISMVLVVVMLVCSVATLVACGVPSDYNDAKANLEEKGYEVEVITLDAAIKAALIVYGAADVKVETMVIGLKDEEAINLVYCENKDEADKLLGKIEEFMNEAKEALDEMIEDKESDEYKEALAEIEDSKIGKSGTVVYFGTAQGYKDVK